MDHENDFTVKTRKASYVIKFIIFDKDRSEPNDPHSWKIQFIHSKSIYTLAFSGDLKRAAIFDIIDKLDNGL
jgi:hypothetical protein